MKILTFSTLYPSAARPIHGIFVETRLRHLLASGQLEAKVVAPVPWFPFQHACFGEYARHARAPREELRHGIEVLHPRYPLIPKIGMHAAPLLLASAVQPALARLAARFPFDIIDAHYFYPDGVAAVMHARRLGRPVVITARGTDVTLIPRYALPRRLILWAARQAAGIITVSRSLKEALVRLGVPEERITVLRNGVDLELFRPMENLAPRDPGVTRLLSVGHLIPRKGHDLAIRALALLPGCELAVIGDGPERAALGELAQSTGVAARVRFVGAMSQDRLREQYAAADVLLLASHREGWANVLLEAMACGTPVVASGIEGTREVVTAPEAGVLFEGHSAEALAAAVRALLARYPDRRETRRYAENFSWKATTDGQLELFRRIAAAT